MSHFRKKPVVVEARQLNNDSMWDIWAWLGDDASEWSWDEPDNPWGERYIEIQTLEGKVKAQDGDWVVKGVKGEFYPCKPDIFALTYEAAPNEASIRTEPPATVEPVTEQELQDIARTYAFVYGQEHSYVPKDKPDPTWQAHPWVIQAMRAAVEAYAEPQPAPTFDQVFKVIEQQYGGDPLDDMVGKANAVMALYAAASQPSDHQLRDALDHIVRVARRARTGTRRLTWIAQRAQSALNGDNAWRELDEPKSVESELRRWQRRAADAEMALAQATGAMESFGAAKAADVLAYLRNGGDEPAVAEPVQAPDVEKAIFDALNGKVCDPEPVRPLFLGGGIQAPTAYGLTMGLLRERDSLLDQLRQVERQREADKADRDYVFERMQQYEKERDELRRSQPEAKS